MAVTQNTNYFEGAVPLPSGYTNPTLPDLPAGTIEKSGFKDVTILSSAVNATPASDGATNLITEVESYITTTHIPDVLGLDVTKTINMNTQILKAIEAKDTELFATGVLKYTVQVDISYVVTP